MSWRRPSLNESGPSGCCRANSYCSISSERSITLLLNSGWDLVNATKGKEVASERFQSVLSEQQSLYKNDRLTKKQPSRKKKDSKEDVDILHLITHSLMSALTDLSAQLCLPHIYVNDTLVC